MSSNPWKIKSTQKVFSNPWIDVLDHKVINPSGNDGIYGEVKFKNYAIGIIPLNQKLETYIVGQYRFPLNLYSWEIPMGGGLKTDDILDSAKRELKEEVGLEAQNWQNIMKLHTSNAVTDEEAHVFLATQLTEGPNNPDDNEELQIRKLPFDEVYRMAMDGEITDAISVAAILKVHMILIERELKL